MFIWNNFIAKKTDETTCQIEPNRVFRKILLHKSPDKEYSRFGFFIFYKFEIFVANKFKGKQLEAIL